MTINSLICILNLLSSQSYINMQISILIKRYCDILFKLFISLYVEYVTTSISFLVNLRICWCWMGSYMNRHINTFFVICLWQCFIGLTRFLLVCSINGVNFTLRWSCKYLSKYPLWLANIDHAKKWFMGSYPSIIISFKQFQLLG